MEFQTKRGVTTRAYEIPTTEDITHGTARALNPARDAYQHGLESVVDDGRETVALRAKGSGELDVSSIREQLFGQEMRFSDKYIRYRTTEMVSGIVPRLRAWASLGAYDALVYIAELKEILQMYSKVLDHSSHHRILVGSLQLLVHSDNWDSLTSEQINGVASEVARLSDGLIDAVTIRRFHRNLQHLEISFFA